MNGIFSIALLNTSWELYDWLMTCKMFDNINVFVCYFTSNIYLCTLNDWLGAKQYMLWNIDALSTVPCICCEVYVVNSTWNIELIWMIYAERPKFSSYIIWQMLQVLLSLWKEMTK